MFFGYPPLANTRSPSVTMVITHSSVESAVSQSFLPDTGSKLEIRLQPATTIWVRPFARTMVGDV